MEQDLLKTQHPKAFITWQAINPMNSPSKVVQFSKVQIVGDWFNYAIVPGIDIKLIHNLKNCQKCNNIKSFVTKQDFEGIRNIGFI